MNGRDDAVVADKSCEYTLTEFPLHNAPRQHRYNLLSGGIGIPLVKRTARSRNPPTVSRLITRSEAAGGHGYCFCTISFHVRKIARPKGHG